jgi:hypothetical protein
MLDVCSNSMSRLEFQKNGVKSILDVEALDVFLNLTSVSMHFMSGKVSHVERC